MLARYSSDDVFLFHQTSDKKLLRMNGDRDGFLTEFKPWSSGSSDLHSERVEVGTESLLSKFLNLKIDRQKFIVKLNQEGDKLNETSVSENQPKLKIFLGIPEALHRKTSRKIGFRWLNWCFVHEDWFERISRVDSWKKSL